MSRPLAVPLPPEVQASLRDLGSRVRKARLRRNMTIEDLASKIGVHRDTVSAVERGSQNVSIGAVMGALWAMGLLPGVKAVADPVLDEVGIAIEASGARVRGRSGHGGMNDDF